MAVAVTDVHRWIAILFWKATVKKCSEWSGTLQLDYKLEHRTLVYMYEKSITQPIKAKWHE